MIGQCQKCGQTVIGHAPTECATCRAVAERHAQDRLFEPVETLPGQLAIAAGIGDTP